MCYIKYMHISKFYPKNVAACCICIERGWGCMCMYEHLTGVFCVADKITFSGDRAGY